MQLWINETFAIGRTSWPRASGNFANDAINEWKQLKNEISSLYLGQLCWLKNTGRKQPTHGKVGADFSVSLVHHFGPTTRGGSIKITLFAGISRVATIYRPNSSELSMRNGRHVILCFDQSFFWCWTPQYAADLHAVHLNGAACPQTAHTPSAIAMSQSKFTNFFFHTTKDTTITHATLDVRSK